MSRPKAGLAPMSAKEELRSLFHKIDVAPFNALRPTPMSVRKISDYQLVQQERLELLWREEQAAFHNLYQHFTCRIHDVNSPTEEPAGDLGPFRSTMQHPELTDYCHKIFLRNLQYKLIRNVDRLAYSNSLVSNVPKSLPQVQVPSHARENLEEFAVKFGLPTPAETLLLSQALGISEDTIRTFCKFLVLRYVVACWFILTRKFLDSWFFRTWVKVQVTGTMVVRLKLKLRAESLL